MLRPNPKVLIAAPVHLVLTDGLQAMGYEPVVRETINQQAAYGLIGECVGVITSTRLQLDKELLDAAPGLQWIGRMGSGMEVIDVPYATQKGIQCYGSPDGNCNAVAEHALGMLLSLIRRISWSHTEMKNGIWKRDENRGYELEGKTVGIIGYGHTGAAFARKLSGFDVRLMAYDKYHPENIPAHIECCDLAAIYQEADIVSFHVPLQQDTIGFFDNAFTEAMRKPFIFVNTSRGQVADTLALYDALKSGKVTGACLDVFEQEPVAKAERAIKDALDAMIHLPNVITTPHIAGYTHEALYKMSRSLLEKIGANHGK
jgi:D-3-phosphoglycerate dehydrogenase